MRVSGIDSRMLAWNEYHYCGCGQRADWEIIIKRNSNGKQKEVKMFFCWTHKDKQPEVTKLA